MLRNCATWRVVSNLDTCQLTSSVDYYAYTPPCSSVDHQFRGWFSTFPSSCSRQPHIWRWLHPMLCWVCIAEWQVFQYDAAGNDKLSGARMQECWNFNQRQMVHDITESDWVVRCDNSSLRDARNKAYCSSFTGASMSLIASRFYSVKQLFAGTKWSGEAGIIPANIHASSRPS